MQFTGQKWIYSAVPLSCITCSAPGADPACVSPNGPQVCVTWAGHWGPDSLDPQGLERNQELFFTFSRFPLMQVRTCCRIIADMCCSLLCPAGLRNLQTQKLSVESGTWRESLCGSSGTSLSSGIQPQLGPHVGVWGFVSMGMQKFWFHLNQQFKPCGLESEVAVLGAGLGYFSFHSNSVWHCLGSQATLEFNLGIPDWR